MSHETQQPDALNELSPLQQSYYVIRKLKASLDESERQRTEGIAIVGAGCRFPGGATDMDSYWRLLRDGVDAVREVPRTRWDVDAYYDPDPTAPAKTATRHGAFLDEVDQFDPLFFGISPREAVTLDPQQRLLLEVSWEALERSGYAPDRLASERSGVFIGVGQMDYAQLVFESADQSPVDIYAGTGNGFCFSSGRLSYVLGLRGPNLAVDTACSSSLVAVHLACQSLRARECDIAVAGGVQLMLSPQPFIALSKMGAISPDGRCKTFDAAANGYGRGEGCGIVILKRLSDAVADGDEIAAVIRGSAVNHDGSSSGLTVPNGLAQQELLRRALDSARVDPAEIDFVETHGTGTQLGDPIDVEALAEVFGKNRATDSPVLIGSVKTNIGHLEAAAGIAGLLKVVLALQHQEIPPHLHLNTPNPHIRWSQIPVRVPTAPTQWPMRGTKRMAGVSSFGLSGTNAHVVLEEPPPVAAREAFVDRTRHVLPLSARTPEGLQEVCRRADAYLATHPDASLGDVCFTYATGRAQLPCRTAVVGASVSDIRQRLAGLDWSAQQNSDDGQPSRIAFLFTGQGSQYVGMGRSLFRTQPSFRATLEHCEEILRPHLDRSLLDVLYPAIGAESPLHDTAYTQPALFAVEYALARLWMSWGVEPTLMLGHSVGEYVAACLGGVFSLEEGLKLIAERGRLMQRLPRGGAMCAVFADERVVAELVEDEPSQLSIAAVNGPQNVVISGDGEAVERVLARLERLGVSSTRLQVSHAFHSPLMEPMMAEFAQVARQVQYEPPRKRLTSNLEGKIAGAEIATADYWVEHVRRSVQFAAGVQTLAGQGCGIYIEMGPKPTLLAAARRCIGSDTAAWLPSLSDGQEDWQVLLQSLATLYEKHARIDWGAFDRDYPRRRVSLPTYPFQRQRYWLDIETRSSTRRDAALPAGGSASLHPLVGARLRLPLSREVRFETHFSLTSPAYVEEHKLFDTVVVPGASHIAMVLGAVHEAFATDSCVIEDLFFPQALVLNADSRYIVQTVLTPQADTQACRVVSLAGDVDQDDPDAWVVHFSGRLHTGSVGSELPPVEDISVLRARCGRELSGQDFYTIFGQAGYGLGDSFQWLGSIWQGDGEALAQMRIPGAPDAVGTYRAHPGLIDSCFQLLAACWPGGGPNLGRDEILVPFTISRFHFHRAYLQGELWCHTRVRPGALDANGSVLADTRLMDGAGRLVAEIVGLELRKASRQVLLRSLRGSLDNALYELVWRPAPAVDERPSVSGTWLIFGNKDTQSKELVEALRAHGAKCMIVEPGESFERRDAESFQVSAEDESQFVRLFQEVGDGGCSGVVYAWGAESGCASVLHILHALAGAGWKNVPRLWLVTRGAVAAGPEPRALALAQSPLWGLGRVIALEHPELRCVRIDLESPAGIAEAKLLVAELAAPGTEDQVAFRDDHRLVARLARLTDARRSIEHEQTDGAYRLTMNSFGILDELHLAPLVRQSPGRGEVEIAVRATGLNLRDVLLALGLFSTQLAELGLTSADAAPFGYEFAGVVTRVGEAVDDAKPGDEVMGSTLGSMNSHVIADAHLICRKPSGLSFEQAATIPAAFMSADVGLLHLAQLKPGERVLIHAAAGGVGQAAVQLALNVGADVFATASPPKWDYLRSQGIRHVMNSRTLEFADRIKELTGGRGVDCVLNSLTGEFIPRSLDVLSPGGRFVELGKFGIWTEADVHAVRPDVGYFNFDMAQLCRDDPEFIASLFSQLAPQFRDKKLQPIVHEAFPIREAGQAFRYMAQAKHIGKVVLTHPSAEAGVVQSHAMLDPEHSYVITGGLGALGLQVAEWMVGHGARKLVLAGRSEPSLVAREAIERMEGFGADVRASQADVSDRTAVERLLAEAAALGPVHGIVHAAGIVDDGILLKQAWPQFRKVMAPKVAGAWNLHELSRDLPLDFFICFSSMASLLGSPGQGNYAAANAFLDALAHHRRATGLPAMSINWGPWAGSGMASRVDVRGATQWSEQGLDLVAPDLALDLLEQLWARGVIQVGVQPLNWSKFLRNFSADSCPPLLEDFVGETARGVREKSEFLAALEAAPVSERLTILEDEIRAQIASVLRIVTLDDIELRAPLFNLGLDSLMAVELKNRLERDLECSMRPTLVFDYPTVEALASYFSKEPLARLFSVEDSPAQPVEVMLEDGDVIADELERELLALEQSERR
jgi:myxalamid-type polyketide synthase MxaB